MFFYDEWEIVEIRNQFGNRPGELAVGGDMAGQNVRSANNPSTNETKKHHDNPPSYDGGLLRPLHPRPRCSAPCAG